MGLKMANNSVIQVIQVVNRLISLLQAPITPSPAH